MCLLVFTPAQFVVEPFLVREQFDAIPRVCWRRVQGIQDRIGVPQIL